jgi:dUTP pyrophosphatase
MKTLKIKLKKLVKHAFIPEYANPGDAGLDLVAIDSYKNHDYKYIEYGTGIAIEIPEGYVGLIYPRSSISKTPHTLANSVGVLDSSYRGEIKLRMRYIDEREDMEYGFGDKVGQLIIMPLPTIELEEVDELSNTERGDGGFGSTDV